MTFKDIHRKVVVETSGPVGKNVTSRVVHSGISTYGKSPLQLRFWEMNDSLKLSRHSRAQFVAAPFTSLLQSPCQNCGRTGRTLGTAPAAGHFPANPLRVAEGKARHPFLRAAAALRPPETRREVCRDTAASILSIL